MTYSEAQPRLCAARAGDVPPLRMVPQAGRMQERARVRPLPLVPRGRDQGEEARQADGDALGAGHSKGHLCGRSGGHDDGLGAKQVKVFNVRSKALGIISPKAQVTSPKVLKRSFVWIPKIGRFCGAQRRQASQRRIRRPRQSVLSVLTRFEHLFDKILLIYIEIHF